MKTSIVAVAALVAGMVIGYVVGVRGTLSTRADGPQRAGEERSSPLQVITAPAQARTESPQKASDPDPEKPETSSSTKGDALSQALRAMQAPPRETGNGTIGGRILLSSGEPLPGVKVTADRVSRPRERMAPQESKDGWREFERTIRAQVEEHLWYKSQQRVALTDAAGRYQIGGLVDGPYALDPGLEGYEFKSVKGELDRLASPGSTVDFTASKLLALSIQVLLPDGSTPQQADIETVLPGDQSPTSFGWTPARPEIRLAAGNYRVWASILERRGGLRSEAHEVTLSPGQEVRRITLELRSKPGIRGRVIMPQGEDLFVGSVHIVELPEGVSPDRSVFYRPNSRWEPFGIHDNYRFEFPDLAPGRYLVGATRKEKRNLTFETVTVSDTVVTQDLNLPALDPKDFFAVWALGPAGEPLRHVEISCWSSPVSESSWEPFKVERPDGSFWISPWPDELRDAEAKADTDAAGGEPYSLSLTSDVYGRRRVDFDPRRREEIVVQFSEPATIELSVDGFAGSGQNGRLGAVVLGPGDSIEWSYRNDRNGRSINSEGSCHITPLQPGPFELILQYSDENSERKELHRTPIDAKSGVNPITIPLPRLHQIKVTFEDSLSRMRVAIAPAKGWLSLGKKRDKVSREVGSDGSVVFSALVAGEYNITTTGNGTYALMRVRVPDRSDILFQPQLINAFSVKITDSAGFLAAKGLQAGDLVIGFNGKEFEDLTQMQSVLLEAAKGKEIKFIVLRGEERFEVTIETKAFLSGKDHGGALEPATR